MSEIIVNRALDELAKAAEAFLKRCVQVCVFFPSICLQVWVQMLGAFLSFAGWWSRRFNVEHVLTVRTAHFCSTRTLFWYGCCVDIPLLSRFLNGRARRSAAVNQRYTITWHSCEREMANLENIMWRRETWKANVNDVLVQSVASYDWNEHSITSPGITKRGKFNVLAAFARCRQRAVVQVMTCC